MARNPNGHDISRDYYMNLDSEARRAQSSKAGKASAESARKRKTLREYLNLLLTEQIIDDMNLALVAKAIEGDVRAYHEIRDALGECQEKISVSSDDVINIKIGEADDKDREK